MDSKGWVKLHRSIWENPIVTKDTEYLAVWVYLITHATHSDYQAEFKGERITLKGGQLLTGRKSIAQKLNINETKVQRILKRYEIEQQIEQQTSNKNRLVTVLNWDKYQDSEQQIEQQVNNKRTTSEQQVNTNKNLKNIKNDKNVKKNTYSECVKLTDDEYNKLIKDFGLSLTETYIDKLNDYVLSTGKKYKSHYHTIRNWLRNEAEKQNKGNSKKIEQQESLNAVINTKKERNW